MDLALNWSISMSHPGVIFVPQTQVEGSARKRSTSSYHEDRKPQAMGNQEPLVFMVNGYGENKTLWLI
jgi:hypothetical protein